MGLKQLVVLGDSGVLGWGDRQAGGWCERLRLNWMPGSWTGRRHAGRCGRDWLPSGRHHGE